MERISKESTLHPGRARPAANIGPYRLISASAEERSVQFQISIAHAVDREARGHRRPAGGAIDLADTANRIHGLIEAVDREAGHAGVKQLGHRSAGGGDDRLS